jgi:hypothetical protein
MKRSVILHASNSYIPFGGVGESGHGKYRGELSWCFVVTILGDGLVVSPFDSLSLVWTNRGALASIIYFCGEIPASGYASLTFVLNNLGCF